MLVGSSAVEFSKIVDCSPAFSNIDSPLAFLRTLGTPCNDVWPDVENLPDYKNTFPKWKAQALCKTVKNMDGMGLDLLAVRQMQRRVCEMQCWPESHTVHLIFFSFLFLIAGAYQLVGGCLLSQSTPL